MAQETIVDYETVEKKKTVVVCDECAKKQEDAKTILPVGINPSSDYGRTNTTISEERDMCVSCVSEIFDIEIPEDEKIIKAKTKNRGNVTIETKKEVVKLFNLDHIRPKKELTFDIVVYVFLLLSTLFGDSIWGDKDTPQYTFILGVLGTIVWVVIPILIYFLFF